MRIKKPERVVYRGRRTWSGSDADMARWGAAKLREFEPRELRDLLSREFPGVIWDRSKISTYLMRMEREGLVRNVGPGLFRRKWQGPAVE